MVTKHNVIMRRIKQILKTNQVHKAELFGSFARKEKRYHDIDIVVQLPEKRSLFDLIGIRQQLESALKKKVDLITYKSINPNLRQNIMKDRVRIL